MNYHLQAVEPNCTFPDSHREASIPVQIANFSISDDCSPAHTQTTADVRTRAFPFRTGQTVVYRTCTRFNSGTGNFEEVPGGFYECLECTLARSSYSAQLSIASDKVSGACSIPIKAAERTSDTYTLCTLTQQGCDCIQYDD